MIRELTIPPDAHSAQQAIEVCRGWVIDGCLQCSIFPTLWKDDPGIWGVLLGDLANHISNAIAEETGQARVEIYKRICEILIVELKTPSDKHEGTFVEDNENT